MDKINEGVIVDDTVEVIEPTPEDLEAIEEGLDNDAAE